MLKEVVLRDFPNWDSEKQLSEYQAYKALGDFSPFNDVDYQLMEMVMNNPNAEIAVECEGGVCEIVSSERLDEATVSIDEWIASVSILFDSMFDDNDAEEEIDTATPKLSLYLKSLLNNIRISDNRKTDLLFSPKVKTKDIHKKIYDVLGGKQHKLRVEDEMTYIKKMLGLSGTLTVESILKYPIIKVLIYALKGGSVSTIAKAVYENEADIDNVIGIKKMDPLLTAIRKNIESLKIRIANPDEEVNKQNQLLKFKDALETKKDNLKKINPKSKEYASLETEIKILQDQVDNFDDIYDSILIKNNNKTGNNDSESKLKTEDTIDLSKFQTSIKDVAADILGDDMEDFIKLKNAVDIKQLTFSPTQINTINTVLDGSHKAYSTLGTGLHAKIVKLFMHENKGFGKGELFISEFIEGAEIQGGTEAYDILVNNTHKFEIKSYDIKNASMVNSNGIRLGKDGKIQTFEGFYDLMDLINDVQELFSVGQTTLGIFDIFEKMAKETESNDLKELNILLNSVAEDGKTLLEILRSGEVTPTSFININKALKHTATVMRSISENDFHYAKLFGKTKIDVYAIDERKDTVMSYDDKPTVKIELLARKIDPAIEKKAIEIIDKLLRKDFINDDKFLINIINSIMKEINEIMKEHPMIILGNTEAKIHGKYVDFTFVKITQGIVRIAPIEVAPSAAKELMYFLNS